MTAFHPLINAWFAERYGEPTAIQGAAWPLIQGGRHVLAIAPTGSGKTLTAFLSALSRFCAGDYAAEKLSVLYISPLKALNEDIRRNLLEPLAALRAYFEGAGESFPPITVETRSGDTPPAERRRFYRNPPSILATTPESLNLLLLNPRGRETLSGLRCLILDEIHSVLGTKRGTFLSCQIDRLSLVIREAGGREFQRIGLSATVNPPAAAAEFLGGLMPGGAAAGGAVDGSGAAGAAWEKRPVKIAAPPAEKALSFTVEASAAATAGEDAAARILLRVERNRSTLVFAGSRRGAEKLSYEINQAAGRPLSFAHHGSLAKEQRRVVEQGLAEGKIPCVVATSSLELGIDIGSADEVILAGCPPSVSAAFQRIGRSGHGVGRTSVGRLIPLHRADLLPAAALALCLRRREIEETEPVENPLDVLAQIILALCVEKDYPVEALYALLRGFYAFRNLSRPAYDSVITMLAGCGKKGRLRELKLRLYWDKEAGILSAAPGVRLLLYASGGVITNRGYYSLRLAEGKAKIGELDEEFVWERRLGDSFSFGNRPWRITGIGSEAVEVVPDESGSGFIPFWRADPLFRGELLSRRILEILDRFNGEGDLGPEFLPEFSAPALEELNRYLFSQKEAQQSRGKSPHDGKGRRAEMGWGVAEYPPEAGMEPGGARTKAEAAGQLAAVGGPPFLVDLPGPACIPCEIFDPAAPGREGRHILLHSFRGGRLNYPLCLAVAQELEDRTGFRVEQFSGDDTILLLLPGAAETGDLEGLVSEILRGLGGPPGRPGRQSAAGPAKPAPRGLCRGEIQFLRRLESSSRFGAAFREAAERSLVQPRAGFGKRLPLWIARQRAKGLFDAVKGEEDFPLTAEAWRSCLRDDFDLPGFRALIAALGAGTVRVPFFSSSGGSPFARSILWQETNALLYEGDERKDQRPPGRAGSSLSDRVIYEALGDPALRPQIPAELAAAFAARLRRELPGWAPEDSRSLAEWVKERIAIPVDEWETLLNVLSDPLREELKGDPDLGGRLRFLKREGAALPSVVHREWEKSWIREAPAFLCRWLSFQGPLPPSRLAAVFGLKAGELEDSLEAQSREDEGGPLVLSAAVEGQGEDLVCDSENLDLLLRLKRAGARPPLKERPTSLLAPFLAQRQGWFFPAPGLAPDTGPGTPGAAAAELGEWAAGLTMPLKFWETELLPAREQNYQCQSLEEELREGRLLWYGAGKGRSGFCRPGDLDLVCPESSGPEGSSPPGIQFPAGFFDRPRDYWEIKDQARLCRGEQSADRFLIPAVWDLVWAARLSSDSWEAPRRLDKEKNEKTPPPGPSGPPDQSPGSPPSGPLPAPPGFAPQRRIPRALKDRWKRGAPLPGRWFSLDREAGGEQEDPWYEAELDRDRVRLLLRRWGVLCRPLLERENAGNGLLSWARLLPAMRRMELAGELTAGYFFSGIRSLQFASPGILRDLEAAETLAQAGTSCYWMNAADSASPAGLSIDGLDPRLPARSPRNRLYYRGAELIAVSKKYGRDLSIFIPPEDSGDLIELIKAPRQRDYDPEKKLRIETINGAGAASSPYGPAFIKAGFISDRGKLFLWQA